MSWELKESQVEDARRRIVGCALVVRMPCEGLDEALGS